MTAITDAEVTLTAEDFEFVPGRIYSVRHACGAEIFAWGRDMHAALVAHTARCQTKGNS